MPSHDQRDPVRTTKTSVHCAINVLGLAKRTRPRFQASTSEVYIEMTGSASTLSYEPLPSDDPTQRRPNISLAEQQLGWRPTVSLRAGLAKTIPYFDALLKRSL